MATSVPLISGKSSSAAPYRSARHRSRRQSDTLEGSIRAVSGSFRSAIESSYHSHSVRDPLSEKSANVSDCNAPPYQEHSGDKSQYVRDIVLGVNDGIVSMFLLQTSAWNSGLTNRQSLLFGICGGIAGAISMALGDFISTKSQNEVIAADVKLEKEEHFVHHREAEVQQVRDFFSETLGMEGELLHDVVKDVSQDDDRLLTFMRKVEFGEEEGKDRSPMLSLLITGSFFIMGALPSVVPFACTDNPQTAFVAAAVLCSLASFFVGAFITTATKGNPWTTGALNSLRALVGGGIAWAITEGYKLGS